MQMKFLGSIPTQFVTLFEYLTALYRLVKEGVPTIYNFLFFNKTFQRTETIFISITRNNIT